MHVAFTGGFDSTFLLLAHLSMEQHVEPVYLACRVDARRNCAQEWESTRSLWAVLDARYPGLLAPLRVVRHIQEPAMRDAQARLGKVNGILPMRSRIGGQYEALSAWALTEGVELEVAAEIGGNLEHALHSGMVPPEDMDRALRGLVFPLANTTRAQMMERATAEGWLDILEQTWSCRHPSEGKPCGSCSSCRTRPVPQSPPQSLAYPFELSLILPSWGALTPQASTCVKQLGRAIKESGLSAEIILAPGADGLTAKLPKGIARKAVPGKPGNLGACRNAGADAAEGRVLVFLDTDILVSGQALFRMHEQAVQGKCAMPVVYSLAPNPTDEGCWRGTANSVNHPAGTGSCGVAAMQPWLWAWSGGWPEQDGWGNEDQVMRSRIAARWDIARWAEPGLLHQHHEPDPKSPGHPVDRFRCSQLPRESRALLCAVTKQKIDRVKPCALLIADVRGWAFDRNARDIKAAVANWLDCDIGYIRDLTDGHPFPNPHDYDVVLEMFPWQQTARTLPRERTIGALLHTYLYFDREPHPPGDKEFAHANKSARWWVCNRNLEAWYREAVPGTRYLPIPVDMTAYTQAVTDFSTIRPCWAGNGGRKHFWDSDPKGIHRIIRPVCEALSLPLNAADYHENRIQPADMPAWYIQSNVYLCLSSHEGCSNAVNEAAASGQVIISTDCGHAKELRDLQIGHYGQSGVIIIERTQEALTEALEALPGMDLAEMGRINRLEATEYWSWDVWGPKYAALLMEVASAGLDAGIDSVRDNQRGAVDAGMSPEA